QVEEHEIQDEADPGGDRRDVPEDRLELPGEDGGRHVLAERAAHQSTPVGVALSVGAAAAAAGAGLVRYRRCRKTNPATRSTTVTAPAAWTTRITCSAYPLLRW